MIRAVKSSRQVVVVHWVQRQVVVRSTHKAQARRQDIREIRGSKRFTQEQDSPIFRTHSVGPMCHGIDPGRTRRFGRVGRARQHFAGFRVFSLPFNCRPRNARRPVSSTVASSRALRQGVPLVTPLPRPAFSVAARNRAADDDSFLRPSATAVRREMRRRRAADARRERPTRRDDRAVLYLSLSRSRSRLLSLSPLCAGYAILCRARARVLRELMPECLR